MSEQEKDLNVQKQEHDKEKTQDENGENLNVPDYWNVKFKTCDCGALLSADDDFCWACGKDFLQITLNENKEQFATENSHSFDDKINQDYNQANARSENFANYKTPEQVLEETLGEKQEFARFITCPKCGANNEKMEGEIICWSCNFVIQQGAPTSTGQMFHSSTAQQPQSPTGQIQTAQNKTPNFKPIKKTTKPKKTKKKLVKYVLHCEKCNSWYVFNSYSRRMKCSNCGAEKSVFISYTCSNCKSMFDINSTHVKDKCPNCEGELVLTKESQLY